MGNGNRRLVGAASGNNPVVLSRKIRILRYVKLWTSVVRKSGFSLVVLPLPALSLFPEQSPAYEAMCDTVGKRDISVPMQARMTWALLSPIGDIIKKRDLQLKRVHLLLDL